MRARCTCAIALALVTCGAARPDTITTKDSLSINGSLTEMSNGVVKIKARFPSAKKEVWIPVTDIQSIEFNLLTFNPGAPPKIMGFGGPGNQVAPQGAPPARGVIVLRGGTRQPCILAGIDEDLVHCSPKDAGYARGAVLRIVF